VKVVLEDFEGRMEVEIRRQDRVEEWDFRRRELCYDLKSLEWDKRTTLVLSNTRELNRDPFTN